MNRQHDDPLHDAILAPMLPSSIAQLAATGPVDADLDAHAQLSRRDWLKVHEHYIRISAAHRRALRETIADAVSDARRKRKLPDTGRDVLLQELGRQSDRVRAIVAGLPRQAGNDSAFRKEIEDYLNERVRAIRVRDALWATPEGRRALALLDRHLDGVTAAVDQLGPDAPQQPDARRAAQPRMPVKTRSTGRGGVAPVKRGRDPATWPALWKNVRRAILERGGVAPALRVSRPATEAAVRSIEAKLDHTLPPALRTTVLTVASSVHLEWKLERIAESLENDETLPVGFVPPDWGSLSWDLKRLVRLEAARAQWAELYPDTRRRDGKAWQGRVAFQTVSNGDLLAIDRQSGKVVYLDHEAGPLHGRVLARDFTDFVARFSALGCPGPEHWLLEPFLGQSGLAPDGTVGAAWRAWLGL